MVQVRQFQDHGRLLRGDHRLAFLRHDRHHIAVDGRGDLRVGEVGPGRVHLRVGLGDLRGEGGNIGTQHVGLRLGRLQVLLRRRLACQHLLLPLQREVRLPQAGRDRAPLGLQARQARLRRQQRVLRQHRIDLGQQLPLVDVIAEPHLEYSQLARDLRAHVDLPVSLQRPGGHHVAFHVAAGRYRRQIGGLSGAEIVLHGHRNRTERQHHAECEQHPLHGATSCAAHQGPDQKVVFCASCHMQRRHPATTISLRGVAPPCQ